jgi:hypothetical protein
VMLFEMLAGQPPFVAEASRQVMGMHMFVPPPLLSQLAPSAPAQLAELVQRLLAKNKDERPTMRQVVVALDRLAEQYPLPKRSGSIPAQELVDITRNAPMQVAPRAASTLGLSAVQTLQGGSRLRLVGMLIGTTVAFAAAGLVITSLVARKPDSSAVFRGATAIPSGPPPDLAAQADTPAATMAVPPLQRSHVESDIGIVKHPRSNPSARPGDDSRRHITPASPLPTSKKRPPYAKLPIEN